MNSPRRASSPLLRRSSSLKTLDERDRTPSPTIQNLVEGTVVKIVDGDTVHVSYDGEIIKIRLSGIDAPEKKQEFGPESKEILRSIIPEGSKIFFQLEGKLDRYGRTLSHIYLSNDSESKSVSLQMLEKGAAWHYATYNNEIDLQEAERKAKESRIGLWAKDNPENPETFRKKQKIHAYHERASSRGNSMENLTSNIPFLTLENPKTRRKLTIFSDETENTL